MCFTFHHMKFQIKEPVVDVVYPTQWPIYFQKWSSILVHHFVCIKKWVKKKLWVRKTLGQKKFEY